VPDSARPLFGRRGKTALKALQRTKEDAPAQRGAMGPGVIILDSSGRISAANASATAHLRLGKILQGPHGTLKAANPAAQSALQRVIAGARSSNLRADGAKRLALLSRPNRPPLVMMAAPMTAAAPADSSVLILLHDPEAEVAPTAELLNQAFSLTSAESAICVGLLGGHSLRDIAKGRGTSVNTVRTLLYQVFAKMRIQRQADLVRLLAPLSSMHSLSVGFIAAIQARAVTFASGRRSTDPLSDPVRINVRQAAELEISMMHSEFAPRGSTSRHFATGHELVYVREGKLGIDIAGQALRIALEREIVHVGPGVVHRAFNADDHEPLKVIVMHLKDKAAVHRVNVE